MQVDQTDEFKAWIESLSDREVRSRVLARIGRLRLGAFGDCKSVGKGVSELRIDFGPGYRIYFTMRGRAICLLLSAGTKAGQAGDITRAQAMAKMIRERAKQNGNK
jgi:putative addiction module killer protein